MAMCKVSSTVHFVTRSAAGGREGARAHWVPCTDVYVTDSNHKFGPGISPKAAPMQKGRIKIGNRCWIGAKAVILKDVELGDGCVVGAGAVVTKSFPAGSTIVGVPARLLATFVQSV